MINFTVYGKPIGKQRPRFGRGRAYTPKETVAYEKQISEACLKAMKEGDHLCYNPDESLKVTARFYYPIPASWTKHKTEMAAAGIIAPNTKPDIDNCFKCILDGCQGIAFDDDKQVTKGEIVKVYSTEPRTEITIERI